MNVQADRTTWDRNLAEYRMREALYRADEKFGDHKRANEAYDMQIFYLEREFGSVANAKLDPIGMQRFERAWATITAVDEQTAIKFDTPLDQAAINLALTPAPDLDAAIFKVQLIQDRELDNLTAMPGDCMAIVLADMARATAA